MSVPEPGPIASSPEKDHQRQAFWQIYLPAGLSAAVFIALCGWAALYTAGYLPEPMLPDQQSAPAKVAVIWILLPTCLGSLIQIALLGGSVYLLGRAIRGTPSLFHRAHQFLQQASAAIRKIADRAAAPVISIASLKAGLDRLFVQIAFWKHTD